MTEDDLRKRIERCKKCKYRKTLKSRDMMKVTFEVCDYSNKNIKPWISNISECPLPEPYKEVEQ